MTLPQAITADGVQYVLRQVQPARFVVPLVGHFVQVLHDFETEQWDHLPRAFNMLGWKRTLNPNGEFPDTCYMPGMKPGDFGTLTEPWQNFWFDLMGLATDNTWGFPELAAAWLDVTQDGKAMTDDRSWSHNESGNTDLSKMFREWITGKNLTTNDRDMAIKSLHMGGNIAKVVGQEGANWIIETLNISTPPPPVESVWGNPWLIGWLTQSTINRLPDGRYRVIDWPQLGVHGVPFPVVGFGGRNKLPKDWTKPIANGAKFSPYIP